MTVSEALAQLHIAARDAGGELVSVMLDPPAYKAAADPLHDQDRRAVLSGRPLLFMGTTLVVMSRRPGDPCAYCRKPLTEHPRCRNCGAPR